MAKKIEGMAHQYAERNLTEDGDTRLVAGDSFSATRPGTMYTVSGTLVIHDGPHEPIYTASEVRAMDQDLKWALTWMKNEAAHLREMGTPQPALETAVDMVIKRHGMSIETDHA